MYFLIWGKKEVTRELGYAADFCSLCRSLQSFRISSLEQADHLYYVAIGEKKLLGHLGTCLHCQIARPVDVRLYKTLSSTKDNLKFLITKTFPEIAEYYQTRLDLERELRFRVPELPIDTRLELLMEPFYVFAPIVEEYLIETKVDRLAVKPFMIAGGIFVVAAILSNIKFMLPIASLMFIPMVGFFFYGVFMMYTTHQRFLDQQVSPAIAKCLKPLKPSLNELQGCLNKLSTFGYKIGRRVKVQTLSKTIVR